MLLALWHSLVTCLRHLKTWMRPANTHSFPVHTVRHYLRSLTTFHDMDAESAEILNMFKTVRPRCDFPRIATTFRIVTTSHDLPLHTVRLFDVANGVFRHCEESLPCRRSKVVQWAPDLKKGSFDGSHTWCVDWPHKVNDPYCLS